MNAQHPDINDPKVRAAVQAYMRFAQALDPVLNDPQERLKAPEHSARLVPLVDEATAAIKEAGLQGIRATRLVALARQLYPNFGHMFACSECGRVFDPAEERCRGCNSEPDGS